MADHTVAIYAAIAMFGSVAVAATFPPLNPDGRLSDLKKVYSTIERAELEYCRAVVPSANCGCFAEVAGHILTEGGPYQSPAKNANRIDLARDQARHVCRKPA